MIPAGLLAAAVSAWYLIRYRIVPAVFKSPKVASNLTSGMHAWTVTLMGLSRDDIALYVTLSFMLFDTAQIVLTNGHPALTLHHALVMLATVYSSKSEEMRHDMWRWLTTLEMSNLGLYAAYHCAQTTGRVPLWLLLLETGIYVYGRVWRGSLLMWEMYARYRVSPAVAMAGAVWAMSIAWSGVLLRQSFRGLRGQCSMA